LESDRPLPEEPLTQFDKEGLRRTAWGGMPQVLIHAAESAVKKHPLYGRAKAGDAAAAEGLVQDCISDQCTEAIRQIDSIGESSLIAVHALETEGLNAIPRVFARILSKELNLPLVSGVIQSNSVSHTSATGYHRLAFPALFEGDIEEGKYFLVDDFIGQGGTLANLKGHIESTGGTVLGATVLTGRADSAILNLQNETLDRLRSKHGDQLEEWWLDSFGYGLERLTESEARYLTRVDSFDAIRERLIDARRARNRRTP
jgi:adenine/guanine phosphoribosyltransferase-like PRPP-binding protein